MCAQGLGWEQAEGLLGGPGSRHSGRVCRLGGEGGGSRWTVPEWGSPDGPRMALPTLPSSGSGPFSTSISVLEPSCPSSRGRVRG